MGTMSSQITHVTIVFSAVCSSADQRKHQRSASLAFVRGIHRWPVNSQHKGPVTWKMFPFHDVIVRFLIWSSPASYGVFHYDDVIMTMLASQITSLMVVYSIVYSVVNQRKHQSSASLAFVREIHRGPVNFPHKWPVTRKMFPFDDVIMSCEYFVMIMRYRECTLYQWRLLETTRYREYCNITLASLHNQAALVALSCTPSVPLQKLKCIFSTVIHSNVSQNSSIH